MRYENNMISGGSVSTDWGTSQTSRGIHSSVLSTWTGWTSEQQLGFCGIPNYVGSLRGPITGINAIIPSGDSMGTNGSDYNATIIFTGWNGADNSGFPLIRNMNRKVACPSTLGSASMFISVGGSAGARTLDISTGNSPDNSSLSIPLGTVGEGRWFMLRVHAASTAAVVPSNESPERGDDVLVTATVSGSITPSDGASVPFTVTGARRFDAGATDYLESNLAWSSNFGAGGGIFYDRPNYFYASASSGQCSIGYVGFDTDPELTLGELASLENSFKKTFTEYVGPC
jgi:hypothetical protein